MSYCTGEAGIDAARASSAKHLLESSPSASMPPPPVPSGDAEERKKKAEELFSKKRLGEGDLSLNKDRLAKALGEERKRKAKGDDDDDDRFGKKQRGGPGQSHEVSEEELGMFTWSLCPCFLLRMVPRGIPDEPADDGRPDGQLCGHGGLRGMVYGYAAAVLYCLVCVMPGMFAPQTSSSRLFPRVR